MVSKWVNPLWYLISGEDLLFNKIYYFISFKKVWKIPECNYFTAPFDFYKFHYLIRLSYPPAGAISTLMLSWIAFPSIFYDTDTGYVLLSLSRWFFLLLYKIAILRSNKCKSFNWTNKFQNSVLLCHNLIFKFYKFCERRSSQE